MKSANMPKINKSLQNSLCFHFHLHEDISPKTLLLYDTLFRPNWTGFKKSFSMALWQEYSWIQIYSLLTSSIIQVHIFPVHSFMENITKMKIPYRTMVFIFDHLCFLLPRKCPLPLLLSFYWHSWQVGLLRLFYYFTYFKSLSPLFRLS